MTTRHFNNVTTLGSLTAPVASSAVTFTTTGFSAYPTVPFTITVDRNTATEEICLVTAVATSTLTVTRGYDGTAAQAHSAGATVEHTAGAIEYSEANAHVNATATVHGVTGNVVGNQGAQTIFDKTLVSPVAQADVTSGDAVVAYDPTGVRNLFRGMDSTGTDVITVDHTGKVNAAALAVTGASTLTGALTANGGVTVPLGKTVAANGGLTATTVTASGAAALNGGITTTTVNASGAGTWASGSVTGTLAVTGATTLTGALAANGGLTVPTGKKATLTDAPATGTDAANKTYVDAVGTRVTTLEGAANLTNGGTTSVMAGTAPSAGQKLTVKTVVVSLTSNASGDATVTFPSAFANGLVALSVTVAGYSGTLATAPPNGFIWAPYAPTLSGVTLRLFGTGSSTPVASGVIHAVVTAIGW